MAYFYKENPKFEALINQYFGLIAEYNREKLGGQLSVILLGSLSRGEGTWVDDRILSDIEYFTVYPDGFNGFSEYENFCKNAADKIFSEQNSTLFHIDNTFVRKENLKVMERKLLTYDALKMGKCVVGEDCINLLGDITLENINLRDIKDILMHRVFSVLYYGLPLKNSQKTDEYRYCLAKNSLDLMTVLLVEKGILESGFINRLQKVKQLDIDENIKNYFEFCLSIKLSGECEFEFSIEEMENMFVSLVKMLKKNFHIPIKNLIINKKFVTRRFLGIVKRSFKYRHIPQFNHLNQLIKTFENKALLDKKLIKKNLVINGYPLK